MYAYHSTWNVHSMVDMESPIEIASQQYSDLRGEGLKVALGPMKHVVSV